VAGTPIDASDEGRHTPLHIAASLGHAGVVKALVARGAELDRFDGDQLTPLHRAVAENRPDTVEELLAAGADPSRRGQRGFSPLLVAVAMAPPSIVQKNRMSMDEEGMRFASVTVYQPVSPETIRIVRALAAARVELNAEDENGQTALHWAVLKRSPELTGLILELGADRARQDRQGRTPAALAEAAACLAEAEGPLVSLRALAVESLLRP
jgi:ankyrin repeat protein